MHSTKSKLNLLATGKCPVCQRGHAGKHLFNLGHFQLFRCSCGHRFIDPSLDARSQVALYQSAELLQEVNPALTEYYEYETLTPKTHTYQDYLKTVSEIEHLTPGRTLLEVGCGTGSLLKLAADRGWQVVGVDSSADNIEKVKAANMGGVCSDYLSFQPDQAFDVVVLWDLIEHAQVPSQFVTKSWQTLKPGGLLVFATPHYPNLLSIFAEFLFRVSAGRITSPLAKLYVLEHTSYFSRKSLSSLLHNHQFQILKSWKTETDLARYRFSPLMTVALYSAFALAKCMRLQNRINLIAQKCQ